MGDIFREIDEEIRQERYERLWQQYGRYVIAFLAVVVLAFAGWQGWNHYERSQREAASEQYVTAIRLAADDKKSEADSLFASLIDKGNGSYAVLSRFHEAALKAEADDRDGAAAAYLAIAEDSSVGDALRDAARVFSVSYAMDQPDADAKALQARLDPVIARGSPWRSSARELAGLLALRSGDAAAAKKHFQAIADDLAAPSAMRGRAAQVLSVIGS